MPLGVLTVMSTVPISGRRNRGDLCGADDAKRTGHTAADLTAVAPEKFAPVMETLVPPDGGPVFGLTPVTAGADP